MPGTRRQKISVDPGAQEIRFGFGAIKGTGKKAIEAIVAARQRLLADGRKVTLHALCSEVDPTEVVSAPGFIESTAPAV